MTFNQPCKSDFRILTKTSDVQDADEVGGRFEGEALVDSGHHVVEQAAVHGLRQGVPSVVSLLHFEWHSDKRHTERVQKVRRLEVSVNLFECVYVCYLS